MYASQFGGYVLNRQKLLTGLTVIAIAMEGDKGSSADAQFISFQDFSPINRSGGAGQAQLDIGISDQRTFGNLQSNPPGIGIIEDLQGFPGQNEGSNFEEFLMPSISNSYFVFLKYWYLVNCRWYCSWICNADRYTVYMYK